VDVDDNRTVADRSAYELVLTPRGSATKVGSVHIAVDGATKTPLGVQVYARNASSPAIDVAFTNIRFGPQAERNFVFSPPANATVHEGAKASTAKARSATPGPGASTGAATAAGSRPKITGSGWTRVVALTPGRAAIAKLPAAALKVLTPVSGAWGTGRLLDASLLSVLITSDGRVFAGAVSPDQLYAAAGSR
jgi:hypothetical protein